MSQHEQTGISELSRAACIDLLASSRVGRIAFSFHDRVDIEPISYVYADGWLYARTSRGTKLTTMSHHPWVAFEVDEIASEVSWRSVVVRGAIFLLNGEGVDSERVRYAAALEHLRRANPQVLTHDDPAPHRDVLFCIHVDDVTGREAGAHS